MKNYEKNSFTQNGLPFTFFAGTTIHLESSLYLAGEMVGGAGNDTLIGGSGKDIFIHKPNEGTDRIKDYSFSDGDIFKILKADEMRHSAETTSTLAISGGGKIIFEGHSAGDKFKINGTTYTIKGKTLKQEANNMEDDNSIAISGEDAILTIGNGKITLKGARRYDPRRLDEIVACGEGNDVINCRRTETDSELNIETGNGEDVIVNYEELKEFLATGGDDKIKKRNDGKERYR